MKDSDLRSIVLKQFYDRRSEGNIGIGDVDREKKFTIPPGVAETEVLRIADQLAEHGLLAWNPVEGDNGISAFGVGKITALGVDVVDRDADPPLPINLNYVTNNIAVSNSTGVQIAGDNSTQTQTFDQNIEKLIQAINSSQVAEAQKEEAKSALRRFVETAGWLFAAAKNFFNS